MRKISIVFLLGFIIFLTNCSKENDNPSEEGQDTEIILEKNQLKSFELALIKVSKTLRPQAVYNGFIDNENINFRPNGNYLIFQVPTGSPGVKNGSLTINGEDFTFQYQLETISIDNPESYLQNYFAEQRILAADLKILQDKFIEDSIPGFEDIRADLATWDQIANDAQAELAALSTEDKEKLAQLIGANSDWIQRLDDALLFRSINSMNKISKSECKNIIDQGRIELFERKTFSAAATAIRAYWCSLNFDERQYEDTANDFERGALLATDVEFSPGLDVLNTLANLVFRKMDAITKELQGSASSNGIADEIEDVQSKAGEVPFRNGEPESVFAKIRFRSMDRSDINTSGPVGQAATFFDQIINSYNETVAAINRPLIWRPGFTQTTATKDFNQFLNIPSESVSNKDVVLINTQYVDDKWEVAFGNDGNEEEPTFTFELNYDDGHVQLQKSIDAKIGETGILNDLFVIKRIREINDLDVSNPLWNTTNTNEAITFLNSQQGIVISNGRIVEIDFENIQEYRFNLEVLPPEIGDLTNLTKFDVNYTLLTNLPPEIGNLNNLTTLQITNSNLITLPSEIENLTNLTMLSFQSNEIISIPSEIGNMTNLNILHFTYNPNLTNIPSEIGNLVKLDVLALVGNENLKCLPQEIWDLLDNGTQIDAYWDTQVSGIGDIDCNN